MGILDSLFGRKDEPQDNYQGQQPYNQGGQQPYGQPAYGQGQNAPQRPQNADEQAVARYRYMLQTAPPQELEQAHAEAFGRLTPEQRKLALQQMASTVPENERNNITDDPQSLARAATRAEIRQPGTIERMFGNQGGANQGGMNQGMGQGAGGMMGGMGGGMMGGGGMGMGGMLAGSLLTSLAGGFIGSSIAHSFFSNSGHEQAFQNSPEAASVDGGVNDYNAADYSPAGLDASNDPMGDPADGGVTETAGSDAAADPYGDPGADTDTGGFDTADFDTGGFDGGFDGGGDF